MSTVLPNPVSQKLADLKLSYDPTIAYRLDLLYPRLEGWGAAGQIRRKHKLVARFEPRLKALLRPGEEVLYVAKGVQYKFSEHYFMGILALLINQTAFVLTNVRLLMIHTDTRGNPHHTYWTIYYNQIDKFQPAWTGQVVLKLRDGTKLRFTGFDKQDRKQMPAIFQKALEGYRELGFDPAVTQSRENLCGHCFQVVPRDEYVCQACGARFWKPSEVALRSLCFPSWGDFLMRHTSAAIFELIGYCFFWIVLLALVLSSIERGPVEVVVALVVTAVAVALQHGVDAALTYFIAKKGLIPRKWPPGH